MHNGQTRRIHLSLHLTPGDSRADLRAMQQLKQWHRAVQQAENGVNDVNMQIRRFHRNVYLAGLQLHLLKPQLCSHIAESLGRETLTLEALCGELYCDALLPASGAADAAPPGFSDQQLEQMRTLLSQTALSASAPADEACTAEIGRLRGEISQLKTLLEQQSLLLQQLKMTGRTAGQETEKGGQAETVDLAAVGAPMQKMQKIRQKGIF